jgi:hypothetical protein
LWHFSDILTCADECPLSGVADMTRTGRYVG